MAITVAAIAAEMQAEFGEISTARAVTLINKCHQKILRRVRIADDNTEDISLTAETDAYALDDDIIRIWDAVYYADADDYNDLKETSIDELDYENPGWRQRSSSRPRFYAQQGSKLILFRKPDTSTSGTYPLVRLYVARAATLSSGSSLPSPVLNSDAWLYGACKRYAASKHRRLVDLYTRLEYEALIELARSQDGRQVRNKPTIKASIPKIRGA